MSEDWQKKVDRARWWAVQEQPFYGSLAMRLLDEEAPAYVTTAATDGKRIYWSPDFVASLTDREVRFVLLHETLHCAHQHLWRLPLTAAGNIAGDHVINLELLALRDAGAAIDMPEGGLADKQFSGYAEEEVLKRLPDGSGEYTDACGGWAEPEPGASPEAMREDWTRAVIQADIAARAAQGETPASLQRTIAEATVRRIDWRAEMADFVKQLVPGRKDWARPARRHALAPCIVPRYGRDECITRIVFVRDTSGSVSDADLARYNVAIVAVMADTGCSALVLDCDSTVGACYELEPGDTAPKHATGGGGTDFRPAFKLITELEEAPAGIVYMTDLRGTFPASCDYPTLWLVNGGGELNVPFGRIVEI